MNKRRLASSVLTALFAGGGLAAAGIYRAYRRDLRNIRARQDAGSQTIATAGGSVEYAAWGEGEPVLLIHATAGDYNQGWLMARMFVGEGFHFIAPSRPGYLRTPQIADPSAAGQSDHLAELLDALSVPRAAVVGMSAGGPVAMQFALRHPERTTALVLLSTAAYIPPASGSERKLPASERVYKVLFGSDFIFWALVRAAGPLLEAAFGATPELRAGLPPGEKSDLHAMTEAMLPIRRHAVGLANDAAIAAESFITPYPLERISVPALVIQASDDVAAVPAGGKYVADHIPGASLVWFESGGHILLGHHAEIRTRVRDFLAQR